MAPCPSCGGTFSDAVFCPRDGTRLVEELAAGQVLDNRYRLIREVGSGSMGVVYEAEHVQLHRKVAVKLIKHHLAGHPEAVQRLEREAQLTSDLGHPNIVQCRDFGYAIDGRVYMVMEWLDGETLEARVDRESVDVATAVEIAVQTCAALTEAHAHDVIHRDLKPANLFLTKDRGGGLRVKVLDFGIAKLTEVQVALTATGVVIGTPNYMAPEQALGESIDARADIYSLGVILYEMVTGAVPFQGDSALAVLHQHSMRMPVAPSILAPERGIPPELERIVMRCLEKKPSERYASAGELGVALASFQHPPAVNPVPAVEVRRASVEASSPDVEDDIEPPVRRRGILWVALALAVAIGGVAMFLALRGGHGGAAVSDGGPSENPAAVVADARVTDALIPPVDASVPPPVDALIDAARAMETITCTSRLFDCTATMSASPKVREPFDVTLVLVGHDPVHARLLATGKLAGRIELKDKRTHAGVHEATAAFDAQGRWTMSLRLERAISYHVHVDLLDGGREIDSAKLPDLAVAEP